MNTKPLCTLRIGIFLSLTFISFSCAAQFNGLASFFSDTTLRALMKTNHISSVTEFVKEDSASHFNGRYFFDSNGLVTDLVTGRGPYYTRMKFTYNKTGLVTKQVNYNNMDTSKVESWSERTYGARNRMLKSVRGLMHEGKATVNTEYETKILSEKKGAQVMESKRYDGPNLLSTTLSRDSISGKDTLMVSYEYGIDRRTGKRTAMAKTLSRSYVKDRCYYDDVVKYRVFGKTETAHKISTRYFQLDEKGRWISHGEINYDSAYEAFVQEHPEDFNPNYYPPLFMKAIFEAKIKGERLPEDERTLNGDGLPVQTESQGYRYTLKYNEKKQVTEQFLHKDQELVGTLVFWYNDQGLLTKTRNTYTVTHGEDEARSMTEGESGSKTMIQEMTYTYTFY